MSCRLLMIIILLCSIPPVAAGQDGEKPRDQQLDELRREVIQLRQEIAGLRTQLPLGDSTQSGELDQLEERLERRAEQLENKIDAVSRSVAPIAFNPKMVTAVNFAARSDNKEVIDPSPNQSVISNRPFLRTVEEFNAACREDIPFMAGELDGKGTVGITPKKSNWAMPIAKGPFRAYPITGGVTFSFGGIQVDTQARVVNTCNEPIRGLFASGDIVGLFFHNYPSCTGQTRNAVFSHLAGRGAGAMLSRN